MGIASKGMRIKPLRSLHTNQQFGTPTWDEPRKLDPDRYSPAKTSPLQPNFKSQFGRMIPSEIWIWGGSSTRSHQQSTATLPWSSMQVMISGWLYYLRTGTANDLPDEVNASASREQITLGKHTPSAESDGEDAT